jgi:hypothetical protein
MMKRKILGSIFISILLTLVQTTCASAAELKLNASDGAAGDNLDRSVSISGDYAFMGAFGDDDPGINSGSANQTVTNGNANFSTNESTAGTYNISIRFYNTTHYNNTIVTMPSGAINSSKDGLNRIEAVVDHMSTYVLMDSGSTDRGRSGSDRPYVASTSDVVATEVQTDIPVTEEMEAIGMNTGTDESTSAQTEKKGITIFVLIAIILGFTMMRILNELIFNLFSNI